MNYMMENESLKSFDYTSIHRSKAYEEAMNYFDISDDRTREILLAVNEADQNVVMAALSNKLYKHIVDKVDDIDFGTIPLSKGDITKIDNYNNLVDCINIMSEIVANYRQSTDSLDIIKIALQNMIDKRELFIKSYKLNNEMGQILYNTIALSIVSSVSFMITSCIEYVKLSGDEGFEIALDKASMIKTKDHVLYKNLKKFNSACTKGDVDKMINFLIKHNNPAVSESITIATVAGIALVLAIALSIIPLMRELIFYFYHIRTQLSQYFEVQANLLIMNAYNVENNLAIDAAQRKQIADKQRKIAEKFKKISNFFKVNTKTAESKANKDIEALDKEKYKHDDVLDKVPDSADSILF